MKVTYIGRKASVTFDRTEFPRDEPVEYTGRFGKKLEGNRFFTTEEAEKLESAGGDHPFPTDSKEALEAWAKENLGIDLDRRRSMDALIEEVTEKLESAGGE